MVAGVDDDGARRAFEDIRVDGRAAARRAEPVDPVDTGHARRSYARQEPIFASRHFSVPTGN